MVGIGQIAPALDHKDALARARQRASLISDCLVEAQRISNTVISGQHGRKKQGIGENFWQFRPYSEGESQSRIDWRRSARDDHTYIRDLEWEAAHTVWLWADLSPSMQFKSRLSNVSKDNRALVILLALADILARSGERVGCPGIMEPIAARNSAERLATALLYNNTIGMPNPDHIRTGGNIVLISDFLDDTETLLSQMTSLAKRDLRGHIIEIADPAEESFPYFGRTEFIDPETGEKLLAGRAETLKQQYQDTYLARRNTISSTIRRMGWNYMTHHTDKLVSEALITAHMHLSGDAFGGRK